MSNYIYLLQEREFVNTKEKIYKIGMTAQKNLARFKQYPNGSVLLFQMICNDCKKINVSCITENIKLNEHEKKIFLCIKENIKLNAYGKENLSYITDNTYIECFDYGIDCLEIYLSEKNFNEDHKENNNIYKINKNTDTCYYFNGVKYVNSLFL